MPSLVRFLLPLSFLVCLTFFFGRCEDCRASSGFLGGRLEEFVVGKWRRFEVSYQNATVSGNPFDLKLQGTFRHTDSGRILKQLGFYAGDVTWKIYFMPDRVGEWTFVTESDDPDLSNRRGSFRCVESNLPGPLIAEGKRWKLKDVGKCEAPVLISVGQWFKRTETAGGIGEFIAWAKDTVGARLIGTTLVYFGGSHEEVPYVKGREGDGFNLPMWDRLNSHYDAIRDAGMGHYIMFYSDDEESPNRHGIRGGSAKELRLFRYAVARLSCYPIVLWDTGIDIGETRSDRWINWFADWFRAHDPWKHPAGSRTGGGSGGRHPKNGTFYSDGAAELPRHSWFVVAWQLRTVPTVFTDRWREDYARGGFDRERIRRAVWEMGLTGGTGVVVSGNENGGYLQQNYASDLRAAADCGHAARFFRETVVDFCDLLPHEELVKTGREVVLAANPGKEYVAYLALGGELEIDLSASPGQLEFAWYDPRTGVISKRGRVAAGGRCSFTAPEAGDWTLYLRADGMGGADQDH